MLLWTEITVPQIALIHAENVLKVHEVFLGHLDVREKPKNKYYSWLCVETQYRLQRLSVHQRPFNIIQYELISSSINQLQSQCGIHIYTVTLLQHQTLLTSIFTVHNHFHVI